MRARSLIERSNVKLLCTTDDPADDLHWHAVIRDDPTFSVLVLPAWRPDKVLHIEKADFAPYLETLGAAAGMEVKTYDDLKKALQKRMDFFAQMGCLVSDHSLDYVMYAPASEEEAAAIFRKKCAATRPCSCRLPPGKTRSAAGSCSCSMRQSATITRACTRN